MRQDQIVGRRSRRDSKLGAAALLSLVLLVSPLPGAPAGGTPTTSAQVSTPTAEPAASVTSAPVDRPLATVQVLVQAASLGGTRPPPGTPVPGATYETVTGLPVEVQRVDAPGTVVATQVTDAQGQASFILPAGHYWLYVSTSAQAPGLLLTTALTRALPSGQPVKAWCEVDVSPAQSVSATLTLTFLNP